LPPKMKKSLLILILTACFWQAFTQNRPVSPEEIQNSGKYIFGIGEGSNFDEADKNALDHLISQISVQVESYFEDFMSETNGNVNQYTKSVVKTYSKITLQEAKSIQIEEKRNAFKVMRYISNADLEGVFESRRQKIIDYVKTGINAEKDLRIGDALRNYYWALVLLNSHKDHDKISFRFDENSGEQLLMTALPDCMNRIFTRLQISVSGIDTKPEDKYKAVFLDLKYDGKPVDNLDYTFWTGNSKSCQIGARSGKGIAEFFGETEFQLTSLKINIEYSYQNKTSIDLDVRDVFENIKLPYFERSVYKIELPAEVPDARLTVGANSSNITFEKINKVEKERKVRKNVQDVVEAIRKRDFEVVADKFTPAGWEMFNTLISSGNVKVLPLVDTLKIVSIDSTVIVRSVPMKFSYQNNKREFIEQVNFTFNHDLKIEVISFSIGDKSLADIVEKGDRFGTVEDKYVLISFLENYKTAYCLKRLDYIEEIFADNALIIVGHLVKEAEPIDGMYARAGSKKVEYIELSKMEYISRLRKVFNSNEFVNIHFEDNIVKRLNGESKIYGIQLKQDYTSTSYADKGYLFLMIDLNDSINPKIYVRTWQPEKNEDGSIFGLSDFSIH
jgi:hypothetical protein